MKPYCQSRRRTYRQWTREVMVGPVGIGGHNPIRVQSMTTTDTLDVEGTVKQTIALAEAGCEIVRITAPSTKAAVALGAIRKQLVAASVEVPLIADIHFTPHAAMEAVHHVEKIRINPGNYADRKKFKIREYSDNQYDGELERLHEAFSPIVLKCKEYGRAMRIGTNHGSLSDRIMNRYGDTPLGMVESALEFIRICESHGYHDIVLSMKASNPKVMIEAYRLAVAKMADEGMRYPLHLGVTEAGDGEDARIKSTIGIGSLLYDGLGDTIRVSLTEDSVYEIPVASALARRAEDLWIRDSEGAVCFAGYPEHTISEAWHDSIDPYQFNRRTSVPFSLSHSCRIGENEPPAVFIPAGKPLSRTDEIIQNVALVHSRLRDSRIEGLILDPEPGAGWADLQAIREALAGILEVFVLRAEAGNLADLDEVRPTSDKDGALCIHLAPPELDAGNLRDWLALAAGKQACLALSLPEPHLSPEIADVLREHSSRLILSLNPDPDAMNHPLGQYRILADSLKTAKIKSPLWIIAGDQSIISSLETGQDRLIESSMYAGALLCDGIGDILSLETETDLSRATSLAYNILQGAKSRISKTEFVACPSCGRTLFDLQSTTRKIRERTNHLKGVTIAIMGCIVNGPGEMADADFGYVGGAPGKVNLYVGKTPVKYNVPEAEALDRLVNLIQEEGKWTDPPDAVNDEASRSDRVASSHP